MTEVNVFARVEMSATVGEMSATVGEMSATVGGNVRDSGGNVCKSGEIKHGLGNSRLEIAIHNFA